MFDALYVLNGLEDELDRVFDNELHSFCYLASACNSLEGKAEWGYEFSTARGRLPWSGELSEAVRSLAVSGAATEKGSGTRLTDFGKDFLQQQTGDLRFATRIGILDRALGLRALMTVPEIVHALRSRKNFEFAGNRGLSRSITSELPDANAFEGGKETLKEYGSTVLVWAWLSDGGGRSERD